MFTKLTNRFRKLHREEKGLEALQVVMIIAIAAMVMIACAAVGTKAKDWMGKNSGQLFKEDLTTVQGLDGGSTGGSGPGGVSLRDR